jgi:Gram-negative bacterial TonB protein C-terminal
MNFFSVLFFFLFPISLVAQIPQNCVCSKKDKSLVADYFSELQKQNLEIVQCLKKRNQLNPIAKSISHLTPTAVSLPKPYFPQIAKNYRIFGSVDVEIIFDEQGKVIYAKAVSGKKIFYRTAEKAACSSIFSPVRYCGKPTKQKRVIRYNFSF